MAKRTHSVVDLFAGAGGLSEGFRQAGFRVQAGTDIDPDAMATYRANFPEASTVTGDICQAATKERILEAARGATVVVGGPPCQAYSQVRNHARIVDDPRNRLYREFVAVLANVLPRAFLMENVTGIDQMGAREEITRHLEIDGEYRVCSMVVDAADFGVPQTRRRLVFVGIHRSCRNEIELHAAGSSATMNLNLSRFGAPPRCGYAVVSRESMEGEAAKRILADPEEIRLVSAEQAIEDLRFLPPGNRSDTLSYGELSVPMSAYQRLMRVGAGDSVANVQVPRINPDTAMRLAAIPQGGNHRDLDESLTKRYLTGLRWGQDNGSGRLSRRHFYAYRRLHPHIWAWTLNTKADSVYHYAAHRALSVREFARLQSFPDRFEFVTDLRKGVVEGRLAGGPAHSRYRQVGNAVPPLLARAFAEAMLVALQTEAAAELRRRVG